jgi:ParB-like chromosome segregation protein Spo0J
MITIIITILIHPINAQSEEVHLQKQLEIQYTNPHRLVKNPWNPNEVDPINQDKIVESLRRLPFFKPVICRELPDGQLEILGGEHRVQAAMTLEMEQVPYINLGLLDDTTAKKIGLLDNGRYGEDNPQKMAELLSEIGSLDELLDILDIDEAEMSSYFEHAAISDDEFDSLLDDEKDERTEVDLASAVSAVQTHTIIRFKLTVEDAATVGELIKKTKSAQGFTDSDALSNDGNALMHLLGGLRV